MADFLMPALGADMETGKVVQWLVKPGDRVHKGDIVAVVETHKGAIDVEIFLDGVIGDLVALDQPLPVGAVLARVHTDEIAPVVVPPAVGSVTAPRQTGGLISPAARRRATEWGVDWHAIPGSGVDGAVTLQDVERAAQRHAVPPAAPAVQAAPPPRRGYDTGQMRQAIAAAMGRSKREIPHYYLGTTIDFAAASDWLERHNRDLPPEERLLPAVLLLKATALALREVLQLNGHFDQGVFKPGSGVHVGWAIALRGGGLIAPAIHGADGLSLVELMAALRDLVQRARSGGLRSSELTDPTVTVTSLGERGAESVYGVIYPPQVAIIGFGRVGVRPWVVDGRVVARALVNASLAADHRVSDGHLGGQLLAAIDRALQAPQQL